MLVSLLSCIVAHQSHMSYCRDADRVNYDTIAEIKDPLVEKVSIFSNFDFYFYLYFRFEGERSSMCLIKILIIIKLYLYISIHLTVFIFQAPSLFAFNTLDFLVVIWCDCYNKLLWWVNTTGN